MFLNVRLMIGGMATTIVMLICGFVAFAALRVSHEPFGRLPGSAPLQLAETAAPAAAQLAAGPAFSTRMALDVAQIAAAASPVAAEPAAASAPAAPTAPTAADAKAADTDPGAAIPTTAVAETPLPILAEDPAVAEGPAAVSPAPTAEAAAPPPPTSAAGDAATSEAATEAVKPADSPPIKQAAAADEEPSRDQAEKSEKTERAGIKRRPHRTAKADSDDKDEKSTRAAKSKRAAVRKAIGRERVAASLPHLRRPRVRSVVLASPQNGGLEQQVPVSRTRAVRLRRGSAVGGPFVSPPAQ
jgi:hypothetical protein